MEKKAVSKSGGKPSVGYPSTKKEYKTIVHLGRASSGYVVLAKILSGDNKGKKVALKILDLDSYYTENWEVIEKELKLLGMVSHPNLISSLHSFVDESDLHLVMPYMNGGSVSKILKIRFRKGFEDEVLLATILKEALQGIIYLHDDSRIHRDVKAGNILLSTKGEVKLADFGVSSCLMNAGERRGVARTFTGTPCWMAPEVMKQAKGYDYKADIWSFGITALEMAYGKPPLANQTPMKVLVMTLENKPPSTNSYGDQANKFSRSFRNVVDVCLKKDANRRPTAKELIKSKFFKKARGCNYIKRVLFDNEDTDYQINRFERRDKIVASEEERMNKAISIGDFNFDGVNENDGKEDSKKEETKLEGKEKKNINSTAEKEN